jgi:hypothetical protein
VPLLRLTSLCRALGVALLGTACVEVAGLGELSFGSGAGGDGAGTSGAGAAAGAGGADASGSGGFGGSAGATGGGGMGGAPLVMVFGDNTGDDVLGVTHDTFLRESDPSTNYGVDDDVQIDGSDDPTTGLLRFDIGTLLDGATIVSATLRLETPSSTGSSPLDFPIVAVREDWEPLEATWTMRTANDAWAAPGCGPGSSCSATIVGTYRPVQVGTVYDVPIDTMLVQAWVDGTLPNHGLAFKLLTGTDGARFDSSEDSDGDRPRLVIEYQP